MIRINLLKHMPAPTERLQAMLNPSRAGGFISRRETVLGALFLLLAFTILGTQLWLRQEPDQVPVEAADDSPALGNPQFKKGAGAANPFELKKPPGGDGPPPRSAPPPPQPAPETAVAKTAPKAVAKPKPQAPAAAEDDSAFSSKITGVRVTPLEDGVDIFLPVTGHPRVRSFRVDNPHRMVFDIPGAVLEAPPEQASQSVESALVSKVRAAQNSIDPALVRVVLDVPAFPSINHSVSDAGVAIRVRRP